MNKKSLLEWYIAAGVDEAIDDSPVNYFSSAAHLSSSSQPSQSIPSRTVANTHTSYIKKEILANHAASSPLHHAPAAAIASAQEQADQCQTLEELKEAIHAFDGCALKKTANKTVISDGNLNAQLMIIGEAPGREEDKHGIPFCGPSGQLLDRMLAAVGLTREHVYISNTIFWRPPGNRHPSKEETAICLPFVEKHIALVGPSILLLAGGAATTALLQNESSVSRLRGKFTEYNNKYMKERTLALPTYHPSYLLRQPAYKRFSWHDMQLIRAQLDNLQNPK